MRCYERLDGLDPRGRKFSAEPVDVVSMRAFIEECSRRALDVSLQSQNLSNLQRGRLLDILLWAGELFLLLRAPRLTLARSIALLKVGRRPARLLRISNSLNFPILFSLGKQERIASSTLGPRCIGLSVTLLVPDIRAPKSLYFLTVASLIR